MNPPSIGPMADQMAPGRIQYTIPINAPQDRRIRRKGQAAGYAVLGKGACPKSRAGVCDEQARSLDRGEDTGPVI
jgi:hypothetical protein